MLKILILGSAPNVEIPKKEYDYVAFVNGSIAYDNEVNTKHKIHFLSNQIFTERNKGCEHVLSLMRNKKVDHLVIFKSKKNVSFKKKLIELNYNYKNINTFSRLERSMLTLSSLKLIQVFKLLKKELSTRELFYEMLKFFKNGNIRPLKVSTGLLALSFFDKHKLFKNSEIDVYGISFSDEGVHFYDKNFPFIGHGKADNLYLQTLKNIDRVNFN